MKALFKPIPWIATLLAVVDLSAYTPVFTDDDYAEAVWMTTRFYGAQRSGQGPNWILDGTAFPTSFTSDAYNGTDVSGGWFDCGDHVMFGQPQSWASYVLAVSLSTFTNGWHDFYTGDYTDFKAKGNYTRTGGTPNGLPDLLEELRYEADYLVKAAISNTQFVHRKGDGDADHSYWVNAGKMSTLTKIQGGGARDIIVDASDAYTPGFFAATLAVMARVDPDATRRSTYLAAALKAYAYAKSHTGVASSQSYYNSTWWDGRWADGPFNAALQLWLTTGENTYKTDATTYFNQIAVEKGTYTRFAYANAVPLSLILAEKYLGLVPSQNWLTPIKVLDQIYSASKNAEGAFTKETGGGGSFSVRTPSGGAFLYAVYSVLNGITTYDDMIQNQVEWLLGENNANKSYVTGYDRFGTAPPAPHHRGYYASTDISKAPGVVSAPTKNKQMGGMIAGSFSDATHNTNVDTWNINEVCVDLNAPMVGALGYIMERNAPSDQPIAIRPLQQKSQGFQMVQSAEGVTLQSRNGKAFDLRIVDMQGRTVYVAQGQTQYHWKNSNAGIHRAILSDGKGNTQRFSIAPRF